MAPTDTEAAALTGHARARPWFWIIPSLTFGVGLLAGTALTAGDKGRAGPQAASSPPPATAAPPATASGDLTITVPESCEQGLERARRALSTANDAIDALGDLDAARIAKQLGRLQTAQQEVNQLAEQCRTDAMNRN